MNAKVIALLLLALGLLVYLYAPRNSADGRAHEFDSDSTECVANLRAIYDGLLSYVEENGRPPEGSGVAFFAELVASGHWPNDEEHARRLTCPGVALSELGLAGKPANEWFASLDGLDGTSSGYAGRDQAGWPVATLPSTRTEPLVACDNATGANHADVTNVLMGDGSILSLELENEIANGNVPEGTERFVVGPDADLPELSKLSLD